MQETIELFNKRKNELETAIDLIKKGDLQSLLDYFQVGYTSGTWHFPSIVTRYNHEVSVSLATMLNKELKETRFYVDIEKAKTTGSLELYYGEDGNKEVEKNVYKKNTKHVCTLNLNQRKIDLYQDYDFKIEKLKEELEHPFNMADKYRKQKKEIENWIQKYDKFPTNIFLQKKISDYYFALQKADGIIRLEQEQFEKRIENNKRELEMYQNLIRELEILKNTLKPYNFAFNGYFENDVKHYRLYQVLENEEKIETFMNMYTSGGLRKVGPFIGFDTKYFKQKDIKECLNEISLKPHEILQNKFKSLIDKKEDLKININNMTFNEYGEEKPHWLEENLKEALLSQNKDLLRNAIDNQQNEGYDLNEIEIEFEDNIIIISRDCSLTIKGKKIDTKKILNSNIIKTVLGY